jgi:hypothetical protein
LAEGKRVLRDYIRGRVRMVKEYRLLKRRNYGNAGPLFGKILSRGTTYYVKIGYSAKLSDSTA